MATDVTTIRVRPVQGRTVDPFRGTPDDDTAAQRLASRDADSQPWDDVFATIERIGGVAVKRAGRRLQLERGDETLKVAFVSGARRVGLEDLVLEGDARLAIAVMHALLPLFGPVELRAGRFEDLIDGHEPVAAIVERYDAWFVEDSLRVAKKLEQRDAAAAEAAHAAAQEIAREGAKAAVRKERLSMVALLLVAVGLIGLAVGGPWLWRWATKASVGEACAKREDCASEQCLPREPMRRTSFDFEGRSVELPSLNRQPADPRGVCTERCASDDDCPEAMQCRELASVGQFGSVSRTLGCVPRAWSTDATRE